MSVEVWQAFIVSTDYRAIWRRWKWYTYITLQDLRSGRRDLIRWMRTNTSQIQTSLGCAGVDGTRRASGGMIYDWTSKMNRQLCNMIMPHILFIQLYTLIGIHQYSRLNAKITNLSQGGCVSTVHKLTQKPSNPKAHYFPSLPDTSSAHPGNPSA